MIYVVIPVFNRINYTSACLESLKNQTFRDYHVIVVDHGSTDGTTQYINDHFPEVTVLNGDESMWWTAATNVGIKHALQHGADYILTLNNDLVVAADYLSNLMKVASIHNDTIIGSVSVDIANPERVAYSGTRWNAWLAKYTSPVNKMPYSSLKQQYVTIETDLLPGRGTLIPATIFKATGLFDEKNFPHYAADEDLSASAKKKGFHLLVSTAAVVYSHVEQTGIMKEKISLKYMIKIFSSIKSPKNLKIRWKWAVKHAKTPAPLYFLFDCSRLLKSVLVK